MKIAENVVDLNLSRQRIIHDLNLREFVREFVAVVEALDWAWMDPTRLTLA
jgi:hypothetical protein